MVEKDAAEGFAARFAQAMRYVGAADRAAFGRLLGIDSGQVLYNWVKRDKRVPDKERRTLAALGVSIDWLNLGEGSMTISPRITARETSAPYVRIQQIDAEGDMGDGRVNEDYPEVVRAMDFDESYIRGLLGFLPAGGRLKLMTGRGDSMEPVIRPGDVVVVDTGCISFEGDGIYLINSGNGQQIKALQDRGDSVYVVSANATLYPPFPVPSGTLIGGRVYLRNRIDRMN